MVFTKDECRGEKGHRQTIIITYNLSWRIIIPIKSFYGTEVESKNKQNKKQIHLTLYLLADKIICDIYCRFPKENQFYKSCLSLGCTFSLTLSFWELSFYSKFTLSNFFTLSNVI